MFKISADFNHQIPMPLSAASNENPSAFCEGRFPTSVSVVSPRRAKACLTPFKLGLGTLAVATIAVRCCAEFGHPSNVVATLVVLIIVALITAFVSILIVAAFAPRIAVLCRLIFALVLKNYRIILLLSHL